VPLFLAALGEIFAERSGVLNLGIEGMMLLAAMTGFHVALATGSPWLGLGAGGLAGIALAAIHAAGVVYCGGDPVVSGLALGFFGFSYFAENRDRLKTLAVDDGKPENGEVPVAATLESIRTGTYQPLSRPVFVYASKRSLERPEVKRFLDFYLSHGRQLAQEVGFVALPERAYELIRGRIDARHTGSLFVGSPHVGVSMETLLEKTGAQ